MSQRANAGGNPPGANGPRHPKRAASLPTYAWCATEPIETGARPPSFPVPPIPHLLDALDPGAAVQDVRADASGAAEPLVRLADPRIRILGAYWHEAWPFAVPGAFLREGVARRLRRAASVLPDRYGLAVWDAWRDPRLQRLLHDRAYEDPTLPAGFVDPPSADPARPSPHSTGAAVDITLTWDNVPLALGTTFDAFVPLAASRSLEDSTADGPDAVARDLRRLLRHVMVESGFVQLRCEWWHFEFGTRLWAAVREADPTYPAHPGPTTESVACVAP